MLYRSGKPKHINGATSTSVDEWPITGGPTLQIDFRNTHASVDIELFLTKDAANAGAGNGFIVPANFGYTFEVEITSFWTRSASAGTFAAIVACRP